jgi:hypothetical protein
MTKQLRRRSAVRSAACKHVESLEQRRLLTTLIGPNVDPSLFPGAANVENGEVIPFYEFIDAADQTVRISLGGDVVAEFVALQIDPGVDDPDAGRPPNVKSVVDLPGVELLDADGNLPDGIVGADIFKIYVLQATIGSYISIAAVPSVDTEGPRPMEPFDSPRSMLVWDVGPNPPEVLRTPTLASNAGSVYIGALTIDYIEDTEFDQNRPLLAFPSDQPLGVMPAPTGDVLVAGIETAPGVVLSSILIGGVVTGKVLIDGSIDTFYAGHILTGAATGQTKSSGPALLDNFRVTGDLRSLVSLGSIGTDNVPGDRPGNTRYNTGFTLRVDGRLGQVRTGGAFYGGVSVGGAVTDNVWVADSTIREVEFRDFGVFPETSSNSYFEQGEIGDTQFLATFTNDTFNTPQYLAPFRDSSTGRDIIRVLGSLSDSDGDPDRVDYYAIPLLAGQTVEVDLDYLTQWSLGDLDNAPEFPSQPPRELQRSPLISGLFDPDGRLVATDRYKFVGRFSGLDDVVAGMENQSYRFTADKAGIWRIAVGAIEDRTLDGITPDDTISWTGISGDYRLTIRDSGNLSMGGLVADGAILFDQSRFRPSFFTSGDGDDVLESITSDNFGADPFLLPRSVGVATLNVDTGDLGAIVSNSVLAMSELSIDLNTPRIWINQGNLRAVVASSIGRLQLNPSGLTFAPHLGVPRGSIGQIRSTGTGAEDVLYVNPDDANPNTGFVRDGIQNEPGTQPLIRSRASGVGLDIQLVQSATNIAGNLLANRGIGIIRADRIAGLESAFRMPQPYFVADADRKGASGYIGLIEVTGNFGSLETGGPAIDVGVGGNILYMRVGGELWKDNFFGVGGPEQITAAANQSVNLIDDSGTPYTITPIPSLRPSTSVGNPFGGSAAPLGTLSYRAYPVRSGSGAAAGRVLVDVTSTTGLRISVPGVTTGAGVHVGTINANGVGRAVIQQVAPGVGAPLELPPVLAPGTNQLIVEFIGSVPVGAYNLVGGAFTQITNNSPAEIVNVDASSIGTIIGERIGLAPVINGVALLQTANRSAAFETAVGDYPFTDQRTSINVTGSVVSVQARRGLGNLIVDGAIGAVTPNSDNTNVAGEFEGIVAPIYAGGVMHNIRIGEGLADSGTGEVALSGIFAQGRIVSVAGSGRGVDIRGNIISNSVIQTIDLVDGAILASEIGVISDFGHSSHYQPPSVLPNLPQPFPDIDNPDAALPEIELIRVRGVGGIMGSRIRAADIGTIDATNGFGIATSSINTAGSGTINTISVSGLGIRASEIDAGVQLRNLLVAGSGERLRTTNFTESVRTQFLVPPDSNGLIYDPFLNTIVSHQTDLHLLMGTDEDDVGSRKRHKPTSSVRAGTNAGFIADSEVIGSRNVDVINAWQLHSRPFRPIWVVGTTTLDSIQFEFVDQNFPMRIAFGERVGTLTLGGAMVGTVLNSGSVNRIAMAGTVERSSLGLSGRIRDFSVGGNFRGTSQLRVSGPEGSVDRLSIGGFVNGIVEVALGIGSASIGSDFGSAYFFSGRTIGSLTIGGDVLTGSYLRGRDRISSLSIAGDFNAGSVIRSRQFGTTTIGGANNGTLQVG